MSSSMSQDKHELLGQLIEVYQKLLKMSSTDGLPAARRFGPDIMNIASKLQETIPAGGQLSLLCQKLLDATWKEYLTNPKDVNYYVEKTYRESIKGKEALLKKLVAFKADWDRELVGDDGGGSGGEGSHDEYSDDWVSDGGSDDGSDDGDDTEQAMPPEDIVDSSLHFSPAPDSTDNNTDNSANVAGFRMLLRLQRLLS
jgi:hypothetical protein